MADRFCCVLVCTFSIGCGGPLHSKSGGRIIPIKRSGKSISRFLNILMSRIIRNAFLIPTTVPRHNTHVAPLGL